MEKKKRVTQCNSVAHWCVLMELYGTGEEDTLGFDTRSILGRTFIVGLSLNMKKSINSL